jgi:hypothetical protein
MSTHAAALAIVQIRHKEPVSLVNAALGTIDLAEAAFDAQLMINHGHERPPGTRLGDAGTARIYQSPCLNIH